jgi:hypothetical protein
VVGNEAHPGAFPQARFPQWVPHRTARGVLSGRGAALDWLGPPLKTTPANPSTAHRRSRSPLPVWEVPVPSFTPFCPSAAHTRAQRVRMALRVFTSVSGTVSKQTIWTYTQHHGDGSPVSAAPASRCMKSQMSQKTQNRLVYNRCNYRMPICGSHMANLPSAARSIHNRELILCRQGPPQAKTLSLSLSLSLSHTHTLQTHTHTHTHTHTPTFSSKTTTKAIRRDVT